MCISQNYFNSNSMVTNTAYWRTSQHLLVSAKPTMSLVIIPLRQKCVSAVLLSGPFTKIPEAFCDGISKDDYKFEWNVFIRAKASINVSDVRYNMPKTVCEISDRPINRRILLLIMLSLRRSLYNLINGGVV